MMRVNDDKKKLKYVVVSYLAKKASKVCLDSFQSLAV